MNSDWNFANINKSIDSLVKYYAKESGRSEEEVLEGLLSRIATDKEISSKPEDVTFKKHLLYPDNGI